MTNSCYPQLFCIQFLAILLAIVHAISIKNDPDSIISHHRVKRQYFKPSIDGSWLANERSILLKHAKMINSVPTHTPADAVAAATTITLKPIDVKAKDTKPATISVLAAHSNNNNYNNNTLTGLRNNSNEMTVPTLAISLINLFDRIKGTLCKIINQDCATIG